MDSGQRQQFIQKLLCVVNNPERRGLARDLLGEYPATPKAIPPTRRLSKFWGSTPVWGAIGVLAGALVSQISLKLLFLGVWAVLWMEFIRVDLCGRHKRIGNLSAGVLLAILFMGLWKVSPKPRDPPTLDQEMTALLQKFPLLASPPQRVILAPTPAPAPHTHVEYPPVNDIAASVHMPFLPILREGQRPVIPIGFRNSGDFTLQEASDAGIVVLISDEKHSKIFPEEQKHLVFPPPGGDIPGHSAMLAYHTVEGPILTATDVSKLINRELDLCAVGAVRWKDATGRYETDFAQCLIAEDDHRSFNWHILSANNKEHKRD